MIFGTVAKKTQKCRHKDGSVRICPSPSVITFAKTQGRGQARIPREAEKKVREYVAVGKKYAKMRDELDAVNSELVFLGVSKKTPDAARSQVREHHGDSRRGKRNGVWEKVW